MSKLLHSGFVRMKKDKIFWLGLAALFVYTILLLASNYKDTIKYDYEMTPDVISFNFVILAGVVSSVFVSLFVGTEYSDGTIRNKIVVGQKREQIYLSNFILCTAAGLLMYVIIILAASAMGRVIFGPFEMSFSSFMLLFADGALLNIAYAAIFNLIAMLVSNKSYTAIACVLVSFVLLFAGIYIIQCLAQPEMSQQASLVDGELVYETVKNPAYLSGMKRQVYQFFADFLPGAQSIQVAQCGPMHPYLMLAYSAVITVIANISGVLCFRKKDIK